ncbi:MAG: RidA family protein [Halopseudomonas sp.]|uniref:RidA family protein n=1 Tax=Halopseudomonas sp. TaxID=2901191 RepID=UPI003001FFBD
MTQTLNSLFSTAINPPALYDPTPNGYSHVVVAPLNARWLFVAGQGGEDQHGSLASGFQPQLQRCLHNLRIALAAGGATLQQVTKLTVLVVDHDEARLSLIASALRDAWADKPAPACTLIPVPRLALDGMLIEIDATACVGPNQTTERAA